MKQLFAYIRVSTPKQGKGVSLREQRSAIQAYADRVDASIAAWFEEKRTAAKAGRPEFSRMVKLLRQGKAQGVVIHKVDRSTRNFRDWAELDELIEGGIEVHFANETLDLSSRGGRLAADVQVVVAVDYIRNLREEALKGIHGRLKQGILPHHAPLGYLDCGAGKPKAIDPIRGPIIRRLFETYASGSCNLRELTSEATALGLRNANGNSLRLTQIHSMLRNILYAGIIKSARFGLFAGAHEPIVRRALFDRVQDVLSGKFVRRTKRHFFLFRRFMRCGTCGRSLIGSKVKGIIYYRCSTIACPTTSVREDAMEGEVRDMLAGITLGEEEAALIETELATAEHESHDVLEKRRAALAEALAAANARMKRLTTLLLDQKIDPAAHDESRAELILDRQKIEQELCATTEDHAGTVAKAREIVELARRPISLYETADDDQKRRLLDIVMSNCSVTGKTPTFSLREPFAIIAQRTHEQDGRPYWDTPRTADENRTLETPELLAFAAAFPSALLDALHDTPADEGIQLTAV
jgi:site-specific DNA recombinase